MSELITTNESQNNSFRKFKQVSSTKMFEVMNVLYHSTVNILFILPPSHRATLTVLAPAMDVGNLSAAGKFAVVTDGKINRSDNRT